MRKCRLSSVGLIVTDWVYPKMDALLSWSRSGEQSVRSGVKLTTYSTTGFFFEHGNLDSSAGKAKPGKLPSLVMSRARGRGLVVVRARESRVHGEGGQ